MPLLLNSLYFGLMTSIFSVVMGFVAFYAWTGSPRKHQKILLLGSLVCLLLPPFLHVGVWYHLASLLAIPAASLSFAGFVLALQLWPLCAFLMIAASQSMERSSLEAAKISLPHSQVVRLIILPLLAPFFGISVILITILSFNNFIVPTTFQTQVQVTDIYVMFSSLYDTKRAVLESVPLLIISLLLAGTSLILFRKSEPGGSGRLVFHFNSSIQLPKNLSILWTLCFLSLISLSTLPSLLHLGFSLSQNDILKTLSLSSDQFFASLTYAAGAALAATGLSLCCFFFLPRKVRPLLAWGMLIPFIFSGFFLGILLIWLEQNIPGLIFLQGSWIICIIALTLRFIWIVYCILIEAEKRIPSDSLDAARLFNLDLKARWTGIYWPSLRTPLLMGTWIVYILALWDVETLLLLYPPGGEPISLRIFQLLHYGYESQVALLSLGLIILGLLPAVRFLFAQKLSVHD
jgi:iron(III) transport system permease protein